MAEGKWGTLTRERGREKQEDRDRDRVRNRREDGGMEKVQRGGKR